MLFNFFTQDFSIKVSFFTLIGSVLGIHMLLRTSHFLLGSQVRCYKFVYNNPVWYFLMCVYEISLYNFPSVISDSIFSLILSESS